MDPLLAICSSIQPITDQTIFQVDIISLPSQHPILEVVSYPPPEVHVQRDYIDQILTGQSIYSTIRDFIDNINLHILVKNRAGNKLINMLFVYPGLVTAIPQSIDQLISRRIIDSINLSSNHSLSICDIAGGPGSWSLAMLERFPNSQITGVTLYDEPFLWYGELSNHSRFDGFYYDLITDYRSFVDKVLIKHPNGVDLCMCDGGNAYTNTDVSRSDLSPAEHKLSNIMIKARLITVEILTSLLVSAINGNLILKIFYRDHPIMMSLITIIGLCYQHISIIKPVTTRVASKEVYVIGLYRRVNVEDVINHLTSILDNWDSYSHPFTVVEVSEDVRELVERGLESESIQYHQVKTGLREVIKGVLEITDEPDISDIKEYLAINGSKYIVNRDLNTYLLGVLLTGN